VPAVRRKRGSQNKIARDVKNGIIDGAVAHGEDGKGKGGLVGYMRFCARRYPKQYMQLLGRLLPYNISADVASGAIATINIISVPEGHYVSVPQEVLERQPKVLEPPPQRTRARGRGRLR
jgi:hypothetical protein